MSNKNIFISYSRSDLEFVEKLVAALKEYGLDVWFDKHLRTGGDWDDRLEEEINKADHMIIILSNHSVASENVKNEISFAKRTNTSLHPILVEDCSIPLSLARQHYRNFTKNFDIELKGLVEDITHKEVIIKKKKDTPVKRPGLLSSTKAKVIGIVLLAIVGYLGYSALKPKPPIKTKIIPTKQIVGIEFSSIGRYVILGPNPGGLWASEPLADKSFLWQHITVRVENGCLEPIYINSTLFRLYISTKPETSGALYFSATSEGLEFQTKRLPSKWLEKGESISGDLYFKVPEKKLSNGIDLQKTAVYKLLRYSKNLKCEVKYTPY